MIVAFGVLGFGAQAAGGGPDNVVSLSTTAGDTTQERAGVQVGFYGGNDLESTNLARADSHDCTGCRTVAVAVQAVLATGDPSTVAPHNFARSTNENCTGCTTFTFAYQYVVTTDGPVHLTTEARSQISEVRSEFQDLAHSDLPPEELDTRLHDLAAEFKADINHDVRAAGQTPHGQSHLRVDG